MGVIRLADRSITLNLGARVTGFVNGMRTATGAAQDFTARGLDKIEQNSASISTLSNTAGIMGAAMVAGFGAATKAAIDWESNWAGVLKTVDGSTAQLANLEEGLREMARTMPATHAEIAATAEAAGQLGVATDDVLEFTETMVLLGVTTNLSADESATALARFSNIMGTSTDDVGRMGATIVDLGNNSATTEAEIVELATRLAAAGRQAGLTEANIFAVASTLTSVGVEAEAGGTAMSKVFTSIGDAVRDGGENLETFAMVAGVSASEFQQAFGEDAAGAIGMFVEGMGRLAGEGESTSQIFKDLGLTDQRLMRAILSAGTATGLWAEQVDLANAAWSENTALVDEAEQRFATTESKMVVAWNNIKDAGIEFGATVLPMIASVAESVAGVASAFGDLPDWVKSASMAIVGGGGLVLLGIAGLGKLALAVSGVATALGGLGGAAAAARTVGAIRGLVGLAAPIGLTAVAVGAVMAAITRQGVARAAKEVAAAIDEIANSGERLSDMRIDEIMSEMAVLDFGAFEVAKIQADDLAGAMERVTDPSFTDNLSRFFGALPGVTSYMSDYDDVISGFGDGLARLAQDDLPAAQDAFSRLAMEAGGTDQAAMDLLERMPALRDAMIAAAGEAGIAADDHRFLAFALGLIPPATDEAADAQDLFGDALAGATGEVGEQVDALEALIEGQAALAGVVLSAREAENRFEEAIDNATAALKENGETLDAGTDKGRANRRALDDIAESTWDLIGAAEVNGATQEELEDIMERGREEFARVARQMGATKGEAEDLADQLNMFPESIRTDVIVAGIDGAMSRLGALDRTLNTLDGKRVTASVAIRQYGQAAVATGGFMGDFIPGFANGGSPRRARGLMTGPGTTTSDSIDARLSTKEFVLNAASTAKLGVDGAYRINSGNFDRASVRAAIGLRDGGVPVPRQYQATFQSSQGGAPTGVPLAFPSHVTLVDESGGILAHARVVARDEIGESRRREKASLS